MPYFNRLQSDMQQLGVVHDDRPPETYRELVQLMDTASGKDNYDQDVAKNIDPANLSTPFARLALNLYLNDPLITDTPGELHQGKLFGICEKAEYRLATGLMPEDFQNSRRISPIITIEADKAVGIVQMSAYARRMIYYALRESIALPTQPGCVYTIPLPTTAFTEPLRSEHLWSMPSYQLHGLVDTGRLSVFTIPRLERHKLAAEADIEKPALERSHEALLAHAARGLAYTEPVSIKPQAREVALESLR